MKHISKYTEKHTIKQEKHVKALKALLQDIIDTSRMTYIDPEATVVDGCVIDKAQEYLDDPDLFVEKYYPDPPIHTFYRDNPFCDLPFIYIEWSTHGAIAPNDYYLTQPGKAAGLAFS